MRPVIKPSTPEEMMLKLLRISSGYFCSFARIVKQLPEVLQNYWLLFQMSAIMRFIRGILKFFTSISLRRSHSYNPKTH